MSQLQEEVQAQCCTTTPTAKVCERSKSLTVNGSDETKLCG